MGKPKQIFGTYAYMPPEQVNPHRDATVLPTTDIFSFGVMMYQLITGQLPFGTLNDEGSLIPYLKNGKLGHWDRDLLRTSKEGYSWIATIEGCLQPHIQNRFQDVSDVLKTIPYANFPNNDESPSGINYSTNIVNGLLLRVMQGDNHGKVFYLDDIVEIKRNSILRIGRTNMQIHNDIELDEICTSYISRGHCTLELDYDKGAWVIRDGQWTQTSNGWQWKKSTNGTYVNSMEIDTNGSAINPGDIVSIGDVKLRVEGY